MKMTNILILTAMDNEFKDCIKGKEVRSEVISKFRIEASLLKNNDKNFIFAKTGVGPINASLVSSLLVEKYPIDLIVLLGLGGAIDSELSLGNVCIADSIIQHDAVCVYDDRIEQMASGQLHLSLKEDERPSIRIETSKIISEKISKHLEKSGFKVKHGEIVSGSEFSAGHDRKLALKARFPSALMVEMEASAIALVASQAKIPFIVVKTVADTVNNDPSAEYSNFIQSNEKKCVDIYDCLSNL